MGLSLDQTISLLTVMREASGRTGREVGNALNSILSYVQRPIAIKTFEENGIQVFADAAKTQFRNVMEIFQDVAAKWPTLSAAVQDGFVKAADDAGLFNDELAEAAGTQQEWNDLQQRDLAQASAGVYRRNYFIGMIERLSGAQKVLNNMTDAAGYSEAENARTMETLEKKYQSLQAAAQQLAVSMGDAGLGGTLKGLTDAGTDALEMFNSLPQPMKDVILSFAMITLGIKAAQMGLKLFGIELPAITAITTGVTGLKTAVLGLGTAMKTALIANLPLLAITAVVSAVVAIVGAVKRAKEEAEQFIATTKDEIQSLTEQRQGLQQLSTEYETLKSKEANLTATTDEKLRLLQIEKELVSQYDVSITGIDAEGQAYSDSIEAIKLRTQALKDEIEAKKEKLELAVEEKDASDVKTLIQEQKSYDSSLERKKNYEKELSDLEAVWANKSGSFTFSKGALFENTKDYIEISTDEYERYKSYLLDIIKFEDEVMADNKNNIKKASVERKQLLQSFATDIIKQLEDSGKKFPDALRALENKTAEYYAQTGWTIEDAKKNLEKAIKIDANSGLGELIEKYYSFVSSNDTKGVDETSSAITALLDDLFKDLPKMREIVLVIESMFGDSSTLAKASDNIPSFRLGIEGLAEAFSDSKGQIAGLDNELKNLNQIMDNVQKGESLSAENIAKLITQYPELVGAVQKTADGYTIEASALEILRQAKIEEQEDAIKSQLGITDVTTAQLASRLHIYGIELTAIKTLNDARMAAANIGPPENFRGIIPDEAFKSTDELKQSLYDYGEALDLLASLGEKLQNPGYGVSDSNKNKQNEALKKALDLLERNKRMTEESQDSIKKEIAELNRINSLYAKTADERMDMEERIYEAEKRLKDKRLQDAVNWIDEKKSLDQLSANEEIAAWEHILETQSDNIEAVKEATQNLYDLRKQESQKAYADEESSIQHWAKVGVYNIQQQIDKYRELYDMHQNEIAALQKQRQELINIKKANQDIIDSATAKRQPNYGEGNVDLNNRPRVSYETMQAAGWDTEPGSYSTVDTSFYNGLWVGDEKTGHYATIHVTPILPNGKVLTPAQLEDYVNQLAASGNPLKNDKLGLIIKVDDNSDLTDLDVKNKTAKFKADEAAADKYDLDLHNAQAKLYDQDVDNTERIAAAKAKINDADKNILELENKITKLGGNASLTIQDQYKQTENLFSLYKDLLTEQQKAIKDAYDDRIKMIEDEAEKKKAALQEVIKGIEAQEKALDRTEGEHDYAQEMSGLREQLAYWQVRTSEEARQKVADITKQIAEKEHDHEVDLQKQALEDKKQTVQDTIDVIEEAAKAEKGKWETSYNLIEKAFGDHSSDIIAMASTMSKEAYNQWVNNYLVPLQNALKSGNLNGFETGAGSLQSTIDNLPAHDYGMSDADYKVFWANGQAWASASADEKAKLQAKNDAMRTRYGIPAGEYPKFHTGGKSLTAGWAQVLPGEIYFPPNLSTKLEDIFRVLSVSARPVLQNQSTSNATDNRKQINLNGPLLNIENNHMEDDVDGEILSRQLKRAVMAIR